MKGKSKEKLLKQFQGPVKTIKSLIQGFLGASSWPPSGLKNRSLQHNLLYYFCCILVLWTLLKLLSFSSLHHSCLKKSS